jgi:hypothetical protein
VTVSVGVLGTSLFAEAQPPAEVPRIGYLTPGGCPGNAPVDSGRSTFLQGLQERGWIAGQNIVIECRHSKRQAKSDSARLRRTPSPGFPRRRAVERGIRYTDSYLHQIAIPSRLPWRQRFGALLFGSL